MKERTAVGSRCRGSGLCQHSSMPLRAMLFKLLRTFPLPSSLRRPCHPPPSTATSLSPPPPASQTARNCARARPRRPSVTRAARAWSVLYRDLACRQDRNARNHLSPPRPATRCTTPPTSLSTVVGLPQRRTPALDPNHPRSSCQSRSERISRTQSTTSQPNVCPPA